MYLLNNKETDLKIKISCKAWNILLNYEKTELNEKMQQSLDQDTRKLCKSMIDVIWQNSCKILFMAKRYTRGCKYEIIVFESLNEQLKKCLK